MAKKQAKKTSTIKPLAKEDEGRSCGMVALDWTDLLVINQNFSDLYERSEKKAFNYLKKESKEFGFDPEELQQSLLEGGKRDEMDIEAWRPGSKHGDLYGTVGDDEIIFNENDEYDEGEGPSQIYAYGLFGDDIITNNRRWWRTGYGCLDCMHDFNVNAWGGSGVDHFSAREGSKLTIRDLEEGEKITMTDIPRELLEFEHEFVEILRADRSNPNDDSAYIGQGGGYPTTIFIPDMPPNADIVPLSRTIDNVNNTFSRTYEVRLM